MSAVDPRDNGFATRLTEALAQRGLSFAAVRRELTERGVSLSAASLSYWSSGRSVPTRHRSRDVIAALEQVLQVPEGWLLDGLGPAPGGSVVGLVDGSGQLRRAVADHQVHSDKGWQQLLVHQTTLVGADRAEKGYEVREVTGARVDGLQYWAVAVAEHPGAAACEATTGCELVRQLDLSDSLAILEFRTPRPLSLGESVMTGHRVSYPHNGDEATEVGYGLARPTEHLVLQATFEGEVPGSFRVTYATDPGSDPVEVDRPVLVGAHEAQVSIERAQAGLHRLAWQW